MKWVGLSGGLASGKSTVAEFMRQRKVPVLDADRIAREVLQKGTQGLEEVVRFFGPSILSPDEELDRKKLAQVVFSSQDQLNKLESIVHPLVQEQVRRLRTDLEAQGEKLAVYDVPLLFEKNLHSQFDAVVLVTSPVELQKIRMKNRNAWNDEEIELRLKAQWPMSEKEKVAHYILKNDGSLSELERQVEELLKTLRKSGS